MVHFDPSFTSQTAYQMHLAHTAAEEIREEARMALEAQVAAAKTYLNQIDYGDSPVGPFPEGTIQREAPTGERLSILPDNTVIQERQDGSFAVAGIGNEIHVLEPHGGKITLPDGRCFQVAQNGTHQAAGIEGLPLDIEPVDLGHGRFSVWLPDDIRLDLSHTDCRVTIINPGGTILLITPSVQTGIGEEVKLQPIQGGGMAFTAMESQHRGVIETDTLHLSLSNGLDLVIHCSNGSSEPSAQGMETFRCAMEV